VARESRFDPAVIWVAGSHGAAGEASVASLKPSGDIPEPPSRVGSPYYEFRFPDWRCASWLVFRRLFSGQV